MRASGVPVLLLVVSVLIGCTPAEPIAALQNSVEVNGLSVTIGAPKRRFTVGEQFTVVLATRNTTNHPMKILAVSGAPVYVRIWRYAGLSWEEIKRYPETETMVMNPWTLQAKGERKFIMQLTVEPDWPTGELLRLTAELNGREEAEVGLTVEVSRPARPKAQ